MNRILYKLAFMICFTVSCWSCVNDGDFIQEGILRVSFKNSTIVGSQTDVLIEIMDVANREYVILEESSIGSRPIEINLNTGNYLLRITYGNEVLLKGFQIRKGKATEINC